MLFEKQFSSLKLSQKLAELGVKQVGVFEWIECYKGPGEGFAPFYCLAQTGVNKTIERHWSAFTVTELADMLVAENHHFLPSYNSNFDHGWYYKFFQGPTIHEQTLADCMAGMLGHLIENKIALEI